MTLDYKAAAVTFQPSSSDEGRYAGYFSIFTSRDDGGDVILPGAFTKTLQERGPASPRNRIKIFFAHDPDKLIGPPPDVLREDSTGLYAEGRLTLASFWGREAWALMKDGALTEGSIGYKALPVKTTYTPEGRTLAEVMLAEISPVPLGMHPGTAVSAIKAWRDGMFADSEAQDLLYTLLAFISQGRLLATADADELATAWDILGAAQATLADLYTAATPDAPKSLLALTYALKIGKTISAATDTELRSVLAHLEAAEETVAALLGPAAPADADDAPPKAAAVPDAPAALHTPRLLLTDTRLRLATATARLATDPLFR